MDFKGTLTAPTTSQLARQNGELAASLARAEELLASVRAQTETFLQQRIELEGKLEAIARILAK